MISILSSHKKISVSSSNPNGQQLITTSRIIIIAEHTWHFSHVLRLKSYLGLKNIKKQSSIITAFEKNYEKRWKYNNILA